MKLLRLVALLSALTPALAVAQTNLLLNGSFESPSSPGSPADLQSSPSSLDHWTYFTVSGHIPGGTYLVGSASAGTYGSAQDGNNLIFATNGADPGNGLYQDFTATIGQQYTASIYMRYFQGSGYNVQGLIIVEDNNNSLADVGYQTATTLSDTWTQVSFTFTAPSTSLRFSFYDNSLTTNSSDIQFDNARISAVPEPSTYAAMAGLAALGFVGWQRRKRA